MTVGKLLGAIGLVVLGAVAPALASEFPRRPVTLVVPFPAGSGTDGVARVVADSMAQALGQNVLVENKPGQEGGIAGRTVARAEPDGYTILLGGNSSHSAVANLYKELPYRPEEDFVAIRGVVKIPLILTVRKDFPASDLRGFVERAKSGGTKLTFGSSATSTRAAGELLRSAAGFDIVNVPYRGTPAAVTDVLGGRIDVAIADSATVLGILADGQLKPIAATSQSRIGRLPDLPTIAESGYPGFEMVPWLAVFAPAKTPADVVARLREALERVHRDERFLKHVAQVGMITYPADAAEVDRFVRADIARWADVVRIAGIEKN